MSQVKLQDLPQDTRELLRKRQSGDLRDVVINRKNTFAPTVIPAAIGLVWLPVLFLLTNEFRWGAAKTVLYSVVTAVAVYFLIIGGLFLLRRLRFGSASYLLVTPHYVIDVDADTVNYWDLEQLISVESKDRFNDGKYSFSDISLRLEDATRNFKVENIDTAEQTVDDIIDRRKAFLQALAREDSAFLAQNNDFSAVVDAGSSAGGSAGRILYFAGMAVGTIVITLGLTFAAFAANSYFDDLNSWEVAVSSDHCSAYRSYVKAHPQGRRLADASKRIAELYVAAEQKYLTSLTEGYDPQAARAVTDILRYAAATDNSAVQVTFDRHNDIPANVEEQLKEDYEVKQIIPLGESFSEQKMQAREHGLFVVVAEAFGKVIPDDVLEFSRDCKGECIKLNIKYSVDARDSIYSDDRQKDLPEKDRVYYPGISIEWVFEVQIPNKSEAYSFELSSVPAEHITYDSDSPAQVTEKTDLAKVLISELSIIYDSMTKSAFDDFKRNLIERMGIVDNQPVDESKPAPSPAQSPEIRNGTKPAMRENDGDNLG